MHHGWSNIKILSHRPSNVSGKLVQRKEKKNLFWEYWGLKMNWDSKSRGLFWREKSMKNSDFLTLNMMKSRKPTWSVKKKKEFSYQLLKNFETILTTFGCHLSTSDSSTKAGSERQALVTVLEDNGSLSSPKKWSILTIYYSQGLQPIITFSTNNLISTQGICNITSSLANYSDIHSQKVRF